MTEVPYDGRLSASVLDGPPDFDDFWRTARMEADAVEVGARRVRVVRHDDQWLVTEVSFATTDGLRLGGWLREPVGVEATRGIVRLHGYGGLVSEQEADPPLGVDGAVEFHPVLRGLGPLSELPGMDPGLHHVLHGIGRRETYVHRGCVQDVWCALRAVVELVPAAGGRIDLTGGSFGGGIGALALPWAGKVTRACLVVPSFGNHPERLLTPCEGSGEAVRLAVQHDRRILEVLPYVDAATAAARVRIPVLVAAAAVDPAVPPVGQFAIYQALAGERMLLVHTAGHQDYPGLERETRARDAAFAAWLG